MKRYIHSTIVQPLAKMQRQRVLPVDGEVIVRPGQDVSPGQVVVRAPRQNEFYLVDASKQLDIPPEEVTDALLADPGGIVSKGEPLLQRKTFLRNKIVNSPIDGTLYGVRNGRVLLQPTTDWLEIRALMTGKVVNHVGDRGVVIETNGSLIQAIWSSGKEGVGKIKVLSPATDVPFYANQLTAETAEHILIVGRIETEESLLQAQENGVLGLVAGSIPIHLIETARAVNYPVIITDGIGQQKMSQPIFQLLQQSEERDATLLGKTTSEFPRPEIIIPMPATPNTKTAVAIKELKVGQTVRVLRAPHQNETGQIVRLYKYTRATALGGKAHGADIQLTNGPVVFVPYVNLDTII